MKYFVTLVFLAIFISATLISCSEEKRVAREMSRYFKDNEAQVNDLITFFRQLKIDSNEIAFEYEKELYSVFYGYKDWKGHHLMGQNMKIKSDSMNHCLKTLGWTNDTILKLTNMLARINCSSISTHRNDLLLRYIDDIHCDYYYVISSNSLSDGLGPYFKKIAIATISKNVIISSSCAEWDAAYK